MEKQIKIALAGNPNCGKTTLFNALTGSNQFVGNWPGVTVEKKEGKLKKHDDVIIMDLPGIYSLSPYTLEEVVARNYLITERPDAILNIIDGTNLERNLYLTTQLTELGIPVVIAINMMDVVRKNGDKINTAELSRELGCEIIEISALKGTGIMEAAEAAVKAAKSTKTVPMHTFSGPVEHAIAHIEEAAVHNMPEEQQRWYAIKIFERDEKAMAQLKLSADVQAHIEEDIKAAEKELDDDAESIITNERYVYIASLMKGCYKKKNAGKLTASDKIDRVVYNVHAYIDEDSNIQHDSFFGMFPARGHQSAILTFVWTKSSSNATSIDWKMRIVSMDDTIAERIQKQVNSVSSLIEDPVVSQTKIDEEKAERDLEHRLHGREIFRGGKPDRTPSELLEQDKK